MVANSFRLISAHDAHAIAASLPCRKRQRFPGEAEAAECALLVEHREGNSPHANAHRSRFWRRVNGRPEFMVRPGTEGNPRIFAPCAEAIELERTTGNAASHDQCHGALGDLVCECACAHSALAEREATPPA